MFAIIEDSGRQMKVSSGDVIRVDYRADAEAGGKITFDRVLLANGGGASVLGKPLIASATVAGTVVEAEEKGDKVFIQKMRRRKTYRRRTGHRQKYTTIKVTDINVPGLEVVKQEAAASRE